MNSSSSRPIGGTALLLSAAGFLLFFLFNLLTATSTPLPWLDELSYSDPGSVLFFEGVFRSTLWETSGVPLWVGNVPLHPFLLFVYYHLFGFGIHVVRGAGMFYYVAGVFLLWWTLVKTDFLRTHRQALLFVVIAFSATGCVAIFRNGRYDALSMMFVTLATASACAGGRSLPNQLLLFFAAALIPWSGLQSVPFFGIASLVYLGLMGRQGLRFFFVANTGMACGIAALLFFYFRLGELGHFVTAIRGQGHVWWDIKLAVFMNPTYLALLAAGSSLLVVRYFTSRNGGDPWSSRDRAAVALILLGVGAPWVMHGVGKYTLYYSWMGTLPLAAGFLCLYGNTPYFRKRWLLLVLVVASLLPGYPRRLASITLGDAPAKLAAVEAFVGEHVKQEDSLLLDMQCLPAYYAARAKVRRLSFDVPAPPGGWDLYTCVVAHQSDREKILSARFGGRWQKSAGLQLEASSTRFPWSRWLGGERSQSFYIYRRTGG